MPLPSIANCAATFVKLISADLIAQHNGEFDEEFARNGGFGDGFRLLFRQLFVRAFEFPVVACSQVSGLSQQKTQQPIALFADAAEFDFAGAGFLQRIESGKCCDLFAQLWEAFDVTQRMDNCQAR